MLEAFLAILIIFVFRREPNGFILISYNIRTTCRAKLMKKLDVS